MEMPFKSMGRTYSRGIPLSPGRQFTLFLAGILALMLAACGGGGGEGGGGGGGGGGDVVAQCTLTAAEKDNLTPDDVASLPPECAFLDAPPLVGLFILGTETDALGNLKLYVHGVKQDATPMTLADFQQASVTLDGIDADPAATVALAPAGVLSMVMLADYSISITDADVNGMGDLYDLILNNAPEGFEGEVINFSTIPPTISPAVTVKPEPPADHWTEILDGPDGLLAANNYDEEQPRWDTLLYDAMGTGLMGPLADKFDPTTDNLGLVERNGPLGGEHRPATLIIVQTDGIDNASTQLTLAIDNEVPKPNDVDKLMDRCHTTAIMMGTFQTAIDVNVLAALAEPRGASLQALNTNFLQAAMEPYAKSLGNLVVFTLSPDTGFDGKTVRIEVDGLGRDAVEPFDIDGTCQQL
jgi:hypothetical protein